MNSSIVPTQQIGLDYSKPRYRTSASESIFVVFSAETPHTDADQQQPYASWQADLIRSVHEDADRDQPQPFNSYLTPSFSHFLSIGNRFFKPWRSRETPFGNVSAVMCHLPCFAFYNSPTTEHTGDAAGKHPAALVHAFALATSTLPNRLFTACVV